MYWTDYRKGSKKAKGHFCFDVNHQIPLKVYLTDGNGAERPFVSSILTKGQTGIMNRGYQCHKDFDFLQAEKKHLKVYHLIARSEYGVMVQILGGLISYLLM